MTSDVSRIEANVRLAIDQLGPASGLPTFGLDRPSLEYVEGFIERQRTRPDIDPHNAEGLISVLGSFLGACLVEATGGSWQWVEAHGQWSVLFENGSQAFPFTKVRKQFENGVEGGDSIVSFYTVAVNYLATGRLGKPTDLRQFG